MLVILMLLVIVVLFLVILEAHAHHANVLTDLRGDVRVYACVRMSDESRRCLR